MLLYTGRQILDVALIANEVVEDYRSSRKSGFIFKIDFEKAYDHIEWPFLQFVLQKKGFKDKWRSWIHGCLSSVSFSIFVNGRPHGKFKGSKGLRQGDPLSPFLFTLVVDGLSRLMEKSRGCGLINGFEVGKDKVMVSHLQFADDTLFFLKNDDHSLDNLILLLNVFCLASGLKINMAKSQLLGINMDEEVILEKSRRIGCEVGKWPLQYLGLPLGGNLCRKLFWEPVLRKVRKRLEGWKRSFLSRGGRLSLIESIMSSMPIYYLSLFKIPRSVAKEIESLMRDFLWEGFDGEVGDHLVAWKQVCLPKIYGGLGVGDLVRRNKSLLFKWLWRFPLEKDALWYAVIKSKYGLNENRWDSGINHLGTHRNP